MEAKVAYMHVWKLSVGRKVWRVAHS